MKLVTTPGLICKFTAPNVLTKSEEELMNNGFWEFYALEIDEEPTMKEKIDCINKILEETPYFLDDIYGKLKHLVTVYESNMYKLLNEDQELDLNYIESVLMKEVVGIFLLFIFKLKYYNTPFIT